MRALALAALLLDEDEEDPAAPNMSPSSALLHASRCSQPPARAHTGGAVRGKKLRTRAKTATGRKGMNHNDETQVEQRLHA